MNEKITIANDAHLSEIITTLEAGDIKDINDIEWIIRKLPTYTKHRLAKEYNMLENPDLQHSKIIIATLSGWERKRVFEPDEAKEVATALEKCAQVYAQTPASDEDKEYLGWGLKYFAIGHPECVAQVFNILDKYLTDVDVIDPIRSCMSRDHSLIDAGFAAIHRSADAFCAKEAARDAWEHEHPKQAAASRLDFAFANLYNFHGSLENVEVIDKITGYFIEFEKQMSPEWCNLHVICRDAAHHSEDKGNYDIGKKMYLLSECFEEWEKGKRDFKSIMEEKVEREAFIKKVQEKIKERAGTVGFVDISESDLKLLWRVERDGPDYEPDYLKLKKEGKSGDADIIADNKLLMKARKELRDQQK